MRVTAAVMATLLLGTAAVAAPKPEAVLRKELGNEFLKKRDYPRARDAYLAALKIEPLFEDAHYNLGIVYFFRLQDYPRALYHLTTYARTVKDAPDLGQVKSLVFQALDKIEEADRDAYARALAEDSKSALLDFIARRPDSTYAADAREKVRRLEAYDEEMRTYSALSNAAFGRSLAVGTTEALDEYLATYPDSPKVGEAKKLRDQWAEDEKTYREALAAGTLEALDRFVASRPESPYASPARTRAERWRASEEAFRGLSASPSLPSVREFLKKYEGTPKDADARRLLSTLEKAEAEAMIKAAAGAKAEARAEADARAIVEAQARAKADEEKAAADRAWSNAKKAGSAEGYAEFARTYPDHPMAGEAKQRAATSPPVAPAKRPEESIAAPSSPGAQTPPAAATAEKPIAPAPPVAIDTPVATPKPAPRAALTPEEQLRADWTHATEEDSKEAYEGFLKIHPAGDEADAARSRLAELESDGEDGKVDREKKKALDRYRKMIKGK